MSSGLFKNNFNFRLFAYKSYLYMYKKKIALNYLQGLIGHKT